MFRWIRRGYQLFFLGLFLFLVFTTTAALIGGTPVWWFLAFDPLVALSTIFAGHSLYHHLAWSLPLVVATLLLGRFFCGWICPMGVLHQSLAWLARPRRAKERIASNRYRPTYRLKYFLLLALLGAALAGSNQIGLLDPIAFTWRALTTAIVPALDNLTFNFYEPERHFHYSTLISLLFIAALALNLWVPRLYCRLLCPLGALLGLFSKLSLFKIIKKHELCTNCDLCQASCQGAADPHADLRVTECMVCLNCVHSCPEGALAYGFAPWGDGREPSLDLGRRRWVTTTVAGVASVPLVRASDALAPRPNPQRIRPPGALGEEAFLERCVKCGACMKVCPTGGLQPALHEAGLEGLWSPILIPRIGHCEQPCTLCGQVCPTGALTELTREEKVGRPVRLGQAFIDRGRCLPWAMDTPCIVCEEVCPTSPKAVYYREVEVRNRDGELLSLKRPYVDPAHCVGCGLCEARCPVNDLAAIRVTSVGETRDPENRMVIVGGSI